MKKIALEEHISLPEFMALRFTTPRGQGKPFPLDPGEMKAKMPVMCSTEPRLKEMDELGIAMQFLMSGGNGFDFIDDETEAIAKTTAFNDWIASVVRAHPDRFRAFAALPMVTPQGMADELERVLGRKEFVGANISGVRLDGDYLDDEKYSVFWEKANELGAFLYLHPCETPENAKALYEPYACLNGSTWSWGVDTATYILRFIFSGLLDRYPNVKIILGHLGEMLPYNAVRIDGRWKISPMDSRNAHEPSYYLKKNIYITTSGNSSPAALKCALEVMGADRVLFACDYPFESNYEFAEFIEKADISEEERELVCYRNAERLFGLD